MLGYTPSFPSVSINNCTVATLIIQPPLRTDEFCSQDCNLLVRPNWTEDIPGRVKAILGSWVMILCHTISTSRLLGRYALDFKNGGHTIYPWLMNSNAAVIFLVTRNSCANVLCLASVSFADGAGLIGWHGLGLVGLCLELMIAVLSIGYGTARTMKGATSAASRIVARILSK